jgi:hypothetical protein
MDDDSDVELIEYVEYDSVYLFMYALMSCRSPIKEAQRYVFLDVPSPLLLFSCGIRTRIQGKSKLVAASSRRDPRSGSEDLDDKDTIRSLKLMRYIVLFH